MSEAQNKFEQMKQQRAQLMADFNTSITILTKPYRDLVGAVNGILQLSELMIAEKEAEIQKLKGIAVKAANADVIIPKSEVKKKQ